MIKTTLGLIHHSLKQSRSILIKSVGLLSFLILLPYSSYSLAAVTITPMVSGGQWHTLVLKADGSLMAWGTNGDGQLGDGTTTQRTNPVVVKDSGGNQIFDIKAIAAGYQHSLALKTDGTLLAWGNNFYGQLGDGTTTNRNTPLVVTGVSGIQAIAVGVGHSLALKTDGTLLAWGWNSYGQLGDGTTTDRSTPVMVTGVSDIKAIAVGSHHSLALKTDGTLLAWGRNSDGQIGDGSTTNRSTPVMVTGVSDIKAIAAGGYHTIALKTDGILLAWGRNSNGQIGDGTTGTDRLNPVVVVDSSSNPITGIQTINAGAYHTLALKTDGTVLAWGWNSNGQLGDGTTGPDRLNPVNTLNSDSSLLDFLPIASQQDFDGDGNADVFWRNEVDGRLWVYLMNGDSIRNGSGSGEHLAYLSANWSLVGYGDFDSDSKKDILWRNTATGENKIWLMNGTSTPTEVSVSVVMTSQVWSVGGIGDFDADGSVDIFWHNSLTGENRITFMNGTTVTTTTSVNTIADKSWQVESVMDFDDDGKADVLWRHATNGRVWLYLMDGSTIDNGAGVGEHVKYAGADWIIQNVGDFDADGNGDILWRNTSTGRVWMYLMNGATISNGSGAGQHVAYTSLVWDIEAIGDYDGDGKTDIFWRNSVSGENAMYIMNGVTPTQSSVNTVSDLNWRVKNR